MTKPGSSSASSLERSLRERWERGSAAVPVGHVLHGGALGARAIVSAETLGPDVATLERDGTTLADLRGWTFSGLRHVEMTHVDASFSRTQGLMSLGHDCLVGQSRFDGSTWKDPIVVGEWSRSSFREASFQEADVSAAFVDCDMGLTRWTKCVVIKARFARTTFRGAQWRRGRIDGVTFEDVSFENVTFDGTQVSSCRFVRCVFDGACGTTSTSANEFVDCVCPPVLEEQEIDVAGLVARYGRKPAGE